MIFITNQIDGQAAVQDDTWESIKAAAAKNRRSKVTVEPYSEAADLSYKQIKFWKGYLLPALAKDTGDSIAYWENRLKIAVLPDVFEPITVVIDEETFHYLPSIAGISMKNMNLLMEGSVAHLRDEIEGQSLYGNHFHWVTLPDELKRKGAKDGK